MTGHGAVAVSGVPVALPSSWRPLPAALGATYRIQLQPAFGFADAAGMVPDLARLGIRTVYTSPVTEAVPGSTHGYDGTDPTRLRDELGGEKGFVELLEALSGTGLGLCIDVVPNHLAADVRNPWWRDVLAHGRESELGELFDIDWDAGPPEARGKVSLPLLDQSLREAIASGLLRLAESSEEKQPPEVGDGNGAATVVLALGTLELPLASPASLDDDLSEVLAAQHYRLIDWHDPYRDYRRFFDIDGLVGVRVEREEVFERTHSLVLALAEAGALSAIRVDHLDGLADPSGYLRRLTERAGNLPIVIEKILTGDERLRTSWPVSGTTGYEVLDDVGGALVDGEGLQRLVDAARRDGEPSVAETVSEARQYVAETLFGAELERCASALGVPAAALVAATTRLPVYRTYLDGGPVHPDDAAAIEQAAGGHPDVDMALKGAAPLPAILHYQQVTGAIMAKGVEDTAWYRLSGPLAFCEVGGDPGRDRRDAPQRLHERAAIRAAEGRGGLVPWTTHDTKRAGDVRARLYALSEMANAFEGGLERLRRLLVPPGSGAERAGRHDAGEGVAFDTRVLAQLALATLPPPGEHAEQADLAERVAQAMVKGAREAKLRTSWIEPDEAYEHWLGRLVERALAGDAAMVREAFGDLVGETARLGALNSLAAVVLRSALPGVPDCYQADESWNLVLVDPDNRRPPDPAQLRRELSRMGIGSPVAGAAGATAALEVPAGRAAELRRLWPDGRVKVLATAACLRARRATPGPFAPTAGYVGLEPAGERASSVLACYRAGADGSAAVAVVGRLGSRLDAAPGDLPAGESFAGTVVDLPGNAPGEYVEAMSGRRVVTDGRLEVAEVLAELPVALLTAEPAA